MNLDSISRRKLLAGLTGSSAASLVGLASLTERSRAYTNTMQLQTGEIEGLVLDWRETYNDATLMETTAGTTTVSPSGPVISLGNVLPGDTGSLSVRLRIDAEAVEGNGRPAVEPELTFSLTSELASPGIQEFIDAAVWYDTGLFGIGPLGADNAQRDLGERLIASGTLGEVSAALEDGVTLDSSPTIPGTSCLGPDDSITVTFGWSFPLGQENVNVVQGDTVTFDMQFNATQC